MSSRCNRLVRRYGWATILLGAVLWHRAEAAPVLTVCVDSANPTIAVDSRVAREAVATQGDRVKFVRFTGYGKGGKAFPIERFATMANSECLLIMGFPVDVSDPHLPPGVVATKAYASTGFVLVRRSDSPDLPLARMPKGSEVGIADVDTYAGLLYRLHPNIVMHVYPLDKEMLAALEARRIAAGLAWQPATEQYLHAHPRAGALRERIVPGRHMRWDLVALYTPRGLAAAHDFDAGVAALRASGRLVTLVKPFASAAAMRMRLIAVADVTTASAPASPPPPALYTEAQAANGALAYYQNCAMCHGPLLNGQEGGYSGPALKGADFADPSYNFHVSDIFNFVAKLMPAATPGSLTQAQDVDIMAFLLKQNGYPAGAKELTYAQASTSSVPMLYYGE